MSLAYQAGEVEAELDKSPDAFRTISEVADDLDIPQHVLRFWETRFAQIKPLKRGGGRRYYRPDDVDLLRGIRRCLYDEGYTIKGLQRILKEQGARHVQAIGRGGVMAGDTRPGASAIPHAIPLATPRAVTPPASSASEMLPDPHAIAAPGVPVPQHLPTSPQGFSAQHLAVQSIAPQGLNALKAALFELDACRRMLETALSPGDHGLAEEF